MLPSPDIEPPRIDKCVSPPPFIKKSEAIKVTWEEPLFSDNSGVLPKMKQSHTQPNVFPLGRTEVVYTAWDQADNNNTCIIEIIVKGKLVFKLIANIRLPCDLSDLLLV